MLLEKRSSSLHHFITVCYSKWKEEIRREKKEERESEKTRFILESTVFMSGRLCLPYYFG